METKIRIGIGIGPWPFKNTDPETFLEFVDYCEQLDIDSLWLSDRIIAPNITLDPLTFMSYMASRMKNMKFGTSAIVLPTRNPVILAKELATLDFLSKGRLLLVVGLGSNESKDFGAVGVDVSERAQRTDESISVMRKLWTEKDVSFQGKFNSLDNVTLLPRPCQAGGPPIWVGGRSQAALKRAGCIGDGWLVSAATKEEVSTGIIEIKRHASNANNIIEDDHYGVFLPFLFAKSEKHALAEISKQPVFRQDIPLESYMALGNPQEIRKRIQDYMDAGVSKFVMRPIGPGESWNEQVKLLAEEVIMPLQTPFSEEERYQRSV